MIPTVGPSGIPPQATATGPHAQRRVEVTVRPETAAVFAALGTAEHHAGRCGCGLDTRPAVLGSDGGYLMGSADVSAVRACAGDGVDPAAVERHLDHMDRVGWMSQIEQHAFRSAAMSLEQRLQAATTAIAGGGWRRAAATGRGAPTGDVALPKRWMDGFDSWGTEIGPVFAGTGWKDNVLVELTEDAAIEAWTAARDGLSEARVRGLGASQRQPALGAWFALEAHPATSPWIFSERVRRDVMDMNPRWRDERGDLIRGIVGRVHLDTAAAAIDADLQLAHHEPQRWRSLYRARAAGRRAERSEMHPEVAHDEDVLSPEGLWREAVLGRHGEIEAGWSAARQLRSRCAYGRRGTPHSDVYRERRVDMIDVAAEAANRRLRRSAASMTVDYVRSGDLAPGDVIALAALAGRPPHAYEGPWTMVRSSGTENGDDWRIVTTSGHVLQGRRGDERLAVPTGAGPAADASREERRAALAAVQAAVSTAPLVSTADQALVADATEGIEL